MRHAMEHSNILFVFKKIIHVVTIRLKIPFKTFEYFRNKAIQQKVDERTMQICPYASNCTEERVLYNELCSKVNRAVDDLPCQCRRVYKMSREQGMRNKDIARELMISERAVELHISKALSSLRLKLADL